MDCDLLQNKTYFTLMTNDLFIFSQDEIAAEEDLKLDPKGTVGQGDAVDHLVKLKIGDEDRMPRRSLGPMDSRERMGRDRKIDALCWTRPHHAIDKTGWTQNGSLSSFG